jgi:hypothetical protein
MTRVLFFAIGVAILSVSSVFAEGKKTVNLVPLQVTARPIIVPLALEVRTRGIVCPKICTVHSRGTTALGMAQ